MAKSRVDQLRDQLSAEAPSKATWPSGLLSQSALSPELAFELIFEVGWNAQHRLIDVRQDESVESGAARGAIKVPLLPEVHTFATRLGAALSTNRRLDSSDDDPSNARLILSCDRSGEDSATAVDILKKAGYANVVRLEGGYEVWREKGFPCEEAYDDFPDSTL